MWCGDARWCARLLSLATARAQAPVPWRTNAELELRNAELVARYEILEAERAALQVTAVTVAGSGPRDPRTRVLDVAATRSCGSHAHPIAASTLASFLWQCAATGARGMARTGGTRRAADAGRVTAA